MTIEWLFNYNVYDDNSEYLVNAEENENDDDDNYDGFTFIATSYRELKDMGKEDI